MSHRDTLTGKHPVQLAEWWADFDERVMRPVFNKPDALDEWTPRADGRKAFTYVCEVHIVFQDSRSDPCSEAGCETSYDVPHLSSMGYPVVKVYQECGLTKQGLPLLRCRKR